MIEPLYDKDERASTPLEGNFQSKLRSAAKYLIDCLDGMTKEEAEVISSKMTWAATVIDNLEARIAVPECGLTMEARAGQGHGAPQSGSTPDASTPFATAKREQEPVAWSWKESDGPRKYSSQAPTHSNATDIQPLYAYPWDFTPAPVSTIGMRWTPVSEGLPDDDDFTSLVVAVEDGQFIPEKMLILYASLLAIPRNHRSPPITHWARLDVAPLSARQERKDA